MRVIIIAIGSRGDVEPFCALTKELLLAQQNVSEGTGDISSQSSSSSSSNSVDFIVQSNWSCLVECSFRSIGSKEATQNKLRIHKLPFTNSDFYHVSQNQQQKEEQRHEDPRMSSVATYADTISELVLPCWKQISNIVIDDAFYLDDETILVACNGFARQLAIFVSKIHHLPLVLLNLQPSVPNNIYPNYRVSVPNFIDAITDSTANKKSEDNDYEETYWRLEYALEEHFLKDSLVELYEQPVNGVVKPCSWLELQDILRGKVPHHFITIVTAYSDHLIPSLPEIIDVGPMADSYLPINFNRKYWDDLFERTFLKNGQADDDERPICIGFGSMRFSNYSVLIEALQKLNKLAILVGGPPDVASKSDSLHRIPNTIPYPWLLRKCSMMLCHGGAGVVNACLRAGIPCWVCPTMGDQFAFAKLVEAKGFGVQCCANLKNLKADDIVSTFPKVLECQENCDRLQEHIVRQEEEQGSGPQKLVKFLRDVVFEESLSPTS